MQNICFTHQLGADVDAIVDALQPDRLFVLTDETTHALCLPRLAAESRRAAAATVISIGATDTHKTLESLAHVWTQLCEGGATRHSLLLNLGGGMVTDLGGFAAATFKRGIAFVNIPTTLLSMVDAAVGGKTGINFHGLKNEIGCFREAEAVVVDTEFLRSLDRPNLCSGYAEMLKHALLENRAMWTDHLGFALDEPDLARRQELVAQSVQTKQRIVAADPHEKGLRKALNLGHTVGHAFESLAMEQNRPVLHGYAVAWGLACELYLSAAHAGFPTQEMHQTVRFVREHFGLFNFNCHDYERLYALMQHDKKNVGTEINFTLLGGIGEILLNQHLSKQQVFDSFDFFREGGIG